MVVKNNYIPTLIIELLAMHQTTQHNQIQPPSTTLQRNEKLALNQHITKHSHMHLPYNELPHTSISSPIKVPNTQSNIT